MKPKVKKLISWREIESMVSKLAKDIPKKRYTGLYGVPRGGQVVAVLLSHQTGIKCVDFEHINRDTLIVEDIVDSGRTLDYFINGQKWNRKPHTATLLLCKESVFKPNFHAEVKRPLVDWVVFPWEKSQEAKYDNTFNVPLVVNVK